MKLLIRGFVLFLFATGCDSYKYPVEKPFPEKLSEWGLFSVAHDSGSLQLITGPDTLPYTLSNPLFTDYALKLRTVTLSEKSDGTLKPAVFDENDTMDFPPGTVLTKTFYYPVNAPSEEKHRVRLQKEAAGWKADFAGYQLIETRILVNGPDGWIALPYIWDGDEAYLSVAGDILPVSFQKPGTGATTEIDYEVPNQNQCAGCHIRSEKEHGRLLRPIGPTAVSLNTDILLDGKMHDQLTYWVQSGRLVNEDNETEGLKQKIAAVKRIRWDDPQSGSLQERSLAYLVIQCAHCHNPLGPARTSGLYLDDYETVSKATGLCKPPVAAGRGSGGLSYDIVPGKPQESILIYRLESNDPGIMMPELGRTMVHEEGVALLKQWILHADYTTCSE